MNETGNATLPKKLCFVIGPIGEPASEKRRHADWLLEGVIKPTFKESFPGYRVQRADEIMQQGNISTQVINRLFDADLVIADMSLQNANAFYELAIRHMKRLPTIHMIKDGEEIPFDVFPYRAVHFNYTDPKDLAIAIASLRSAVEETIKDGFIVENPITHARGQLELQEHATPEMKVLAEELEALKSRLSAVEGETKKSAAFFGRTYTSPARPRVNRKLRIVFDPDEEKQLSGDLLGLLPLTGIGTEANDTMVISFRASDGELESVIEAIKRLNGVLEVDRA